MGQEEGHWEHQEATEDGIEVTETFCNTLALTLQFNSRILDSSGKYDNRIKCHAINGKSVRPNKKRMTKYLREKMITEARLDAKKDIFIKFWGITETKDFEVDSLGRAITN